jgi:hypothetical protein
MLNNITLSNGRVVVHTREKNGSTLATPTPGYYAFTSAEITEYQSITAKMKLAGEKMPNAHAWTK